MKTVWEMDAGGVGGVGGYETDEEEFLDSPEYRKHHLISVPTPIRARGAVKNENTAKRKMKPAVKTVSQVKTKPVPRKKIKGYQLNYLNLWWNRMVREASKDEIERGRKEEEVRMKKCLKRNSEKQRWNSTEGGSIFSDVQEGPVQHSGVGDRVVGEVVTDSIFNIDFNSVIKERSQAMKTARTEVRHGLSRKGK
jgi:hypothetical protein